jgi:hypothetical protein
LAAGTASHGRKIVSRAGAAVQRMAGIVQRVKGRAQSAILAGRGPA